LNGYKGEVRKTSTVESNDPNNSSVLLVMEGNVKSLIDASPSTSIYFQGKFEQISPNTIDFVGTDLPFHITKIESNLEGKVRFEVETIEDGRKYRLKVVNAQRLGEYGGAIRLSTDLPQKSEIVVRVNGSIQGEARVTPAILLVGRLRGQEAEHTGKVQVVSTRGKSFKITRLNYDERLIQVVQHALPNQTGFMVEVRPRLEGLQLGVREQTTLTIETDLAAEERHEVQIQVVNFPDGPKGPPTQ
jgi:hypothetical protein